MRTLVEVDLDNMAVVNLTKKSGGYFSLPVLVSSLIPEEVVRVHECSGGWHVFNFTDSYGPAVAFVRLGEKECGWHLENRERLCAEALLSYFNRNHNKRKERDKRPIYIVRHGQKGYWALDGDEAKYGLMLSEYR